MHRLMRQRHLPAREGEEHGQRLWWQSRLPAPDGRSSSAKSAVVVARSGRRKSEYDRHAGASGAHLHHPNRAPWRVGLWELSAVFSLLKPAIDAIRVAGGAASGESVARFLLKLVGWFGRPKAIRTDGGSQYDTLEGSAGLDGARRCAWRC